MKNLINQIAQTQPSLSKDAFAALFRERCSKAGFGVPHAEATRQAFDQYRTAARKIKRTAKAKPGTVGPDRIPR